MLSSKTSVFLGHPSVWYFISKIVAMNCNGAWFSSPGWLYIITGHTDFIVFFIGMQRKDCRHNVQQVYLTIFPAGFALSWMVVMLQGKSPVDMTVAFSPSLHHLFTPEYPFIDPDFSFFLVSLASLVIFKPIWWKNFLLNFLTNFVYELRLLVKFILCWHLYAFP